MVIYVINDVKSIPNKNWSTPQVTIRNKRSSTIVLTCQVKIMKKDIDRTINKIKNNELVKEH